MTTTSAGPSPRERLLRAAAELFYAEGVTATGVDRVCKAAGVSKKSLYELFGTKDALVAESLERWGPVTEAGLFPAGPDALSPREAILAVFARQGESTANAGYHGCPFVTTASEVRDAAHPAAVVARRYKAGLAAYFTAQAARAGVADPAALGDRLTIVFDGVASRAVVRGEGTGTLGADTATVLLDAAGVR